MVYLILSFEIFLLRNREREREKERERERERERGEERKGGRGRETEREILFLKKIYIYRTDYAIMICFLYF